jgi:hypothetical protein
VALILSISDCLIETTLPGVRGREDQELCLYLGGEVGLDMAAITVAAVMLARRGDSVDLVSHLFSTIPAIG